MGHSRRKWQRAHSRWLVESLVSRLEVKAKVRRQLEPARFKPEALLDRTRAS